MVRLIELAKILPKDTLKCTPTPPTGDVELSSTNRLAMTGKRMPAKQMVDGVAVTSSPEVAIVLRLADRPFQSRWLRIRPHPLTF